MGRRDKHKQGQSRNNAVFKIAGANAGVVVKRKPGKAREVQLKLKSVSSFPG